MSKRALDEAQESSGKRQKLEKRDAAKEVEQIRSAQQLQQLLTFQQGAVPQLRAEDKSSTSQQQAILHDFLDTQRPSSPEEPCLRDLMQTWSFAAQTNNDALLSTVSSTLSLLLKTLSTLIGLRDHGLTLGRSLLQQSQLKLIARGLSAPKAKEHVISPCIRLLTELVSFDGGALAKQVYSAKSFTLDPKILSRNLSLWKTLPEDPEEARRRPAVRSVAIRYLLANLKFQSSSIKAELLKYSNVFRSTFEHLKQDPTDVLQELLRGFKLNVLQDAAISRQSKSFVLHDGNLVNIATLYRMERTDKSGTNDNAPDQIAHEFLRFVCTNPGAGILRTSSWYPPGTERSTEEQHQANEEVEIDLGLDSVEWFHKFHARVPVRNGTLSKFALGLRPFASMLESELLIDIFRAAPELVANYFIEKANFAFDPKLTATWIGYSAFLYAAVQLPVPSRLGPGEGYGRIPPPTSVILENVLPRALNQQVLTRCLNQKVELITFFATRLLVAAYQKLRSCLTRLNEGSKDGGVLWEDAASRLVTGFSQRCPKMKDLVATWKSTLSTNLIQKEAILHLIQLCYQVTPQLALEEKFDISSALNDALNEFTSDSEDEHSANNDKDTNNKKLKFLELNHLLQIARRTPDMRWFARPNAGTLSPCGSLLKIVATAGPEEVPLAMRELLISITHDRGLVQQQTPTTGLDALLISLKPLEDLEVPQSVYDFMDDIFDRTSKRPIKYEDDIMLFLEEIKGKASNQARPNSLIWAAIVEQWPFVVDRDVKAAAAIVTWIGRYSAACRLIGEDLGLLDHFTALIGAQSPGTAKALIVDQSVIDVLKSRISNAPTSNISGPEVLKSSTTASTFSTNISALAAPAEDPSHKGLHLWSTHSDIPTAVTLNTLPPLIMCLSSSYPEVRSQALTNIRTIMARTQPLLPSTSDSTSDPLKGTTTPTTVSKSHSFPDAAPVYLLLGVLSTTALTFAAKKDISSPVPGIVTSYAAAAARIILDPLHPVYDKVNAFHTRAPKWDVSRIAPYWLEKVLHEPPSEDVSVSLTPASSRGASSGQPTINEAGKEDDQIITAVQDAAATPYAAAAHNEIHFLLCVILSSLSTPADVEILRARGSFEPILALATATNWQVLPLGLRELVVRIVWRTALIEGGATTLVTRFGILAFIETLLAFAGGKQSNGLLGSAGLKALAKCVWDHCDQVRVLEWSGSVKMAIERIAA
ncbi:hypothetical protein FH972_026592 [Carpinus fangiana]|uniref:Nucleolar pre-ribosomal-associated protein 1 N-terminal domain-containing protein n=1 Tax=Carpinus fangiana TaxID=176857 RepID=A0A5N6L4J9_9ROSI|nr:hypothetical protein FH972_026592 [Carpinus fangiana]